MVQDDLVVLKSLGIDVFNENRRYWFIRTQSGMYYDDFINENFVGIEWDEISDLSFIKNANEEEWKEKIINTYKDVEKPGYIMNQIKKFVYDIKAGDIVIIPNEKSRWLAIGEIVEDNVDIFEEKEEVDFETLLESLDESEIKNNKTIIKKRRKVKWIRQFKRAEWDPYLQGIIHSNSAVISADKYGIYIDRMLSQFYIKGDYAYYTYKVNKKKNIPYVDMLKFLNNNYELINYINSYYPNLKINEEDLILKINVQSKGPVQLKGAVRDVLIVGLIIGALFGTNMKFKIMGFEYQIQTDGLPALLNSIKEFSTNEESKEQKKELQDIIEKLEKDKEALEIKFATENIESTNPDKGEISISKSE